MRQRSLRFSASGLLLVTCIGAALLGLAAPALCGGDPAPRAADKVEITTKGIDPPARWAMRHDAEAARIAIRTEAGDAELLLTRDFVAVQLSDRGLARVREQLRARRDESGSSNPLGWFESAVLAAVGSFVEHSAECPLDEVRDARYVDGRIVLESYSGNELFAHIDVDDRDLMTSFSEDDARRFVRKFHHLKGISS
jgi:hypothetical protein